MVVKRRKSKLILFILLIGLVAAGFYLGTVYYTKTSEKDRQLSKLDAQIRQLPELEEDVFTKCMEEKDTAKHIPFCQENTQEQMHTLSQDLKNAKSDILDKAWYEF